MTETILTIKLLRDDAASVDGVSCVVAGRLVAGNGASITFEDEGGLARLVIEDPTFEKRLRARVPVKLDQPAYDDQVRVMAQIAFGKNGKPYIASIESGTLYRRNGKEYVF